MFRLEDWAMFEYQSKFGFAVSVDGLHNLPGKIA